MKSLAADPVSRISEQTRMRHKHRHRVAESAQQQRFSRNHRCPHCGGQALGCVGFDANDPRREPWSGKWPGEADCERLSFFVNGDRSLPDINRLFALRRADDAASWNALRCMLTEANDPFLRSLKMFVTSMPTISRETPTPNISRNDGTCLLLQMSQ
jgi:hypothetical protein